METVNRLEEEGKRRHVEVWIPIHHSHSPIQIPTMSSHRIILASCRSRGSQTCLKALPKSVVGSIPRPQRLHLVFRSPRIGAGSRIGCPTARILHPSFSTAASESSESTERDAISSSDAPVDATKRDVVEGELLGPDSGTDTADSTHTGHDADSTIDIPAKEMEIPPGEKMEFQAETRQLLDIVTNSLYTDKEVFLRELVSNASDSLEKLRHMQATNQVSTDESSLPLEIRIDLDEATSTITIADTGIGMTRDELISNLGTIARSGSKNFVKQLQETGGDAPDPSRGIIGKFGEFHMVLPLAMVNASNSRRVARRPS
jgi:Histidine kinase-, DNA gyrase B-, and HSP90-like ATPase